ncbi:hypothetical protein PHYC_01988 [Phycisphaerales bacterium]|nr:hypothetical protein PHYC_01988 [Phycisphaerales bacterium]
MLNHHASPFRRKRFWAVAATLAFFTQAAAAQSDYVVIAANDLGMHCMQNDFSQIMILPPFNTLRAQVIRRDGPDIVTSDLSLSFTIPGNTHSSDKTNFWEYVQPLLGVPLAPDIGVAGTGMSGPMIRNSTRRDFFAEGIPITPIDDDGKENPYSMALVTARDQNGVIVAQTQAVVPVSWEMSCNLCHVDPVRSTAGNILFYHDLLHGTNLKDQQPVLCASCHSDNALGAPGIPGVPSLSHAMHRAHAERMDLTDLTNKCYACHPGVRTDCQRDVHAASGITCTTCHGDMLAVANPARNPWLEEPRCDSCHTRAGFEFEQPGTLFRNSTGHGKATCTTCHGSPHVIGPATTQTDNAQAIRIQGHSGVLNTCTVCHRQTPSDPFPHRRPD